MLDVFACDCLTFVERTIWTFWWESSWSCQDSSTWRFGLLDILELDPFLDVEGACMSIPYWSRQHVTLIWRTGPILVSPLIHPIGSESWWSRSNVYSRHDPVFPPNATIHIVNGSEVVSNRDLPHETSRFMRYSCHTWSLFESFVMDTQSISRCLNIRPTCSHQRIHFLKLQFSTWLLNHFPNGFLHAWKWLTRFCWVNSSHQSAIAPYVLGWLAECIVRNNSSAADCHQL